MDMKIKPESIGEDIIRVVEREDTIKVKQEIKQEDELIIEDKIDINAGDRTYNWHYPLKLDEEELEYRLKYEEQREEGIKKEQGSYEIFLIEELDADENGETDDNDNDVDYIYDSEAEDDEDDDEMNEEEAGSLGNVKNVNDVYNPNVKDIDTFLHHDHAAIVCHLCQQKFSRCYKWTKHVQLKHKTFLAAVQANYEFWTENMSICKECKTQLRYRSNQLLHFLLNHKAKPVEYLICKICEYQDYKLSGLQEHLQQTHTTRVALKYQCPLCTEGFKTRAHLQHHFREHHSKEFEEKCVYNCQMCTPAQSSFDGSQFQLYIDHLISVHSLNTAQTLNFQELSGIGNDRLYKCVKCFKIFVRKGLNNMVEHYLTHNNTFCWTCKYCKSEYIHQDQEALHLCSDMLTHFKNLSGNALAVSQPTTSKCKELVTTANKESHLKINNWKDFEDSIQHMCPFCNKHFGKFHNWQIHLRERHLINTLEGLEMSSIPEQPDKLQCIKCYTFIRKCTIDLHTHRFQHLPFKPYKCLKCSMCLASYQTALKHAESQCQDTGNSLKSYLVEVQDKKANKKVKLSKGLDSYVEINCALCDGEKFSTVALSIEHFETKHNNFKDYFSKSDDGDKTICKICRTTVLRYDRHTGVSHFMQHLDEKPYKCKKCQRSYSLYRRCKLHITKCHPNISKLEPTESEADNANKYEDFITYACPQCNESLTTFQLWESHINMQHHLFDQNSLSFVDSADGKYKCKECTAVLTTSTPQQQQHKLVHMPFKAFICLLCYIRVGTLATLQRHIRVKHFTSGCHKCPMCTIDDFTTDYERIEHIKLTHPMTKWPQKMCPLCFHIFKELNKHMKTHEINRNKYTCDICRIGIIHLKDYEIHMAKKHNQKREADDTNASDVPQQQTK